MTPLTNNSEEDSDSSEQKEFCFLRLKGLACAKTHVAKQYLKDYECEKCLWQIHQHSPESLQRMERLYLRYRSNNP